MTATPKIVSATKSVNNLSCKILKPPLSEEDPNLAADDHSTDHRKVPQ